MRAAEIHPGDVIAGKYRVRTILSRSPTLQLEAFHVEFDQRVIIKLLLPGTGDDREIERFKREARTLAKLETEHATRIIDVGSEEDGSFYLVRQHVEGEELAQYLASYGPRPLTEAVLLILQAAEAVAEAHSHGIVLREISPAAMSVTRRPGGMPSIKITDFGTAKLMRESAAPTGSSSLTATALFGLSPYSSPELVRKAKSVDVRADVWSLGAVFYALLVGRPPFEGDMASLMLAITREEPPPVTASRRDVSADIDQVIAWALAKDVDGRFKNVYAFAHALRPFAPQEGLVLIDRIGQMADQGKVKSSAAKASVPPPPVIPQASYVESKTLPLSAFGPGGVQAALARSKATLEEEFGDMSGSEDAATVSIGGALPPRAARLVGTIPPPPPSRPPSPWVPGIERDRPRYSGAIPAAPSSEPGASYEQRYNTLPPPAVSPTNGGALAGQSVSQRAPEKKSGFDKRILWGAVASMAVMLPVFLLLLLKGGPKAGPEVAGQQPPQQQQTQTQPSPTPPSPQAPAQGNAVVLNADAAKAPAPPAAAVPTATADSTAKPSQPSQAATHPTGPAPAHVDPPAPPADKPKDPPKDPPKDDSASSGGGGSGTLLAIASGGSCNFSVDGGGRGSGSSLRVSLPAGKHSVTCSPSSGSPKSRGVTIKSGETSMLTFKL